MDTKPISKSRIYNIWHRMKQRCHNPKDKNYNTYGGRGIKVCSRWSNNFMDFLDDMSNGYDDNLTLDRIDSNGDYEPSNCKWSTMKEQNNNRRDNRLITINGKTQTLSQWISVSGLKSSTVRQRYYVYKWDIEKSLLNNKGQ